MESAESSFISMQDAPRVGKSIYEPLLGRAHEEELSFWNRIKRYLLTMGGYSSLPEHFSKGRLLDRTAPFFQSHGLMNIKREVPTFFKHFVHSRDWFHSLLNKPTYVVIAVILTAYFTVILIWAGLWWSVRNKCNMEFESYFSAFYMSLETLSTIG